MKDCFALLQEPRRPWLDAEALKQKFLALSTSFHPDRVHGASQEEKAAAQEKYTDLNAAYNRLRDPKERLLHLIELERGEKPKDTQQIEPTLAAFFTQIHQVCREADALLVEKRTVTSPLLGVALFNRAQETTTKLLDLQQTINSELDRMLAELQQIDAAWLDQPNRQALLTRLEESYRRLSYFMRWKNQTQERITQLAL
jgi:DnaJ-domain-containing protein 1